MTPEFLAQLHVLNLLAEIRTYLGSIWFLTAVGIVFLIATSRSR